MFFDVVVRNLHSINLINIQGVSKKLMMVLLLTVMYNK